MTWKPRPRPDVDPRTLPLDVQQGHLLSRLDGSLDLPGLAILMGLGENEVAGMLAELVALGAVLPEVPEEPEAEEDPPAAAARAATHRARFEQQLHAQA